MERNARAAGARGLRAWHIQIHDNRILTAAHDNGLAGFIRARVDLLMRNVRRHVNEIAGAGLIGELEMIAPAHARTAFDDVEHRLEFAMMMWSGFGVRVHHHRSGPEFSRAGPRMRDRS